MKKIRVLELSGTPFEMGYAHGAAYKDNILRFTKERVRLSGDPEWSGRRLNETEVLQLAEACLDEHERYSPELTQELRGLSAATGLSLAELIVVGGFTDFIDTVYNIYTVYKADKLATPVPAHVGADNCTAFLVPNAKAQNQRGYYGQTWDMHDTATEHVLMLRGKPQNKPEFMAFTSAGCVGMLGMNEHGVSVGINNLAASDGQIGVTWNFVVRKILEQDNADAALNCITTAKLAGAHNFLIMDASGAGYSVEAMPSQTHVTKLEDAPLVHTNHCLVDTTLQVQREREDSSQISSKNRLARAYTLLGRDNIDEHDLQALTRDSDAICVTSEPPAHVETCGAVVMRPATRDMWAVWGLPSENDYEHFKLSY